MTAEFSGEPRAVRLQKFLSRAGVSSRREGERLILQGRVSVDGIVVTELGTRIVPGEQVVRVDGAMVALDAARWLAVYKPAGYLTTRMDPRGRPTVYSVLPDAFAALFHVGRLDRLSEGLLIFTNDGETAHRLLHPSYRIARRYSVDVEGEFGRNEIKRLERGVELEDGRAVADDVRVERLADRPARSRVQLTLREGRKREVRRMMESLDFRVLRLVRVSFGPIELDDLPPGEWRELREDEVRALRALVGLRDSNGDS